MENRYANKRIETLPLKDLKELQLAKVQKMVAFAYENSKFYHDKYDKAGVNPYGIETLDDFAKVPILSKEELQMNYPFGLLSVPFNEVKYNFMSGGTSGDLPIAIQYSDADWKEVSRAGGKMFPAAGLKPASEDNPGDIIYYAFGKGHVVECFKQGVRDLGYIVVEPGVSAAKAKEHLNIMKEHGATAYTGSPIGQKSMNLSALKEFDESEDGEGVLEEYVNAFILAGAPTPPDMARDLRGMGKTLTSAYGSTEIGGVAFSAYDCDVGPGTWHTFGDVSLIEIVDEHNQPLGSGERGRELVTSLGPGDTIEEILGKRAVPLIRYDMGDEVTFIEGKSCECRRTSQYVAMPKRIKNLSRLETNCGGDT